MLLTWRATVFSLRNRSAAIARFVLPVATRRSTCVSRAVSPAAGSCQRRPASAPPPEPDRAPRRVARKAQPAASSSICAVSSSPRCRQARPIEHADARRLRTGASSACQAAHARRSASSAARASRSPSRTAPVAWSATARQERRIEIGGDLRQLVGGGARRLRCRPRPARSRRTRPAARPRDAVLRLVERLADRRVRGSRPGPAPVASAPGRAGDCVPTGWPGGRPPRPSLLTAQPVELGLLVEGRADRRLIGGSARRSQARCASSMASGQAPCNCMISARCTRHWPR